MARIHVDGGTWWSPTGKFMKAGVHESTDNELVEAALRAQEVYQFVTVVETAEEAVARRSGEVPAETKIVRETPLADESAANGAFTTRELDQARERGGFQCPYCEREPLKTKASLVSHWRNKHPEVDHTTGQLREPHEATPAPEASEDERVLVPEVGQ